MKVLGAAAVCVALTIAACAEKDEFSDSTLPPISSEQIARATTTTTIELAVGPQGPRTPTIVGDVCEMSNPPQVGQTVVTYMLGGSLMELTPDGNQAACILDNIVPPPGPVMWSPDGGSVLMGAGTLRNFFGAFKTGIADGDPTLRWTYPHGEFLLNIAEGGRLDRRQAGESRSRRQLGVLSRTSAVASHPAGEHLLVGGLARDGSTAIYISNLEGRNNRPIVVVPTKEATITAISTAPSGDQFGFVAFGNGRAQVFIGRFPELTLTRVIDLEAPIDSLVQSTSGALAVRVGSCQERATVHVYPGGEAVDVGSTGPLEALSLTPLGWLDAANLVVMARGQGCEGSGDLWVVDAADPFRPTLLISGVDSAALRPGPAQALPIDGSLAPNATPADLT